MFNLSKSLVNKAFPLKIIPQQDVFFQTEACVELINEVFSFERLEHHQHAMLSATDEPIDANDLQSIVIVELNQSSIVVEDKNFANRIPNHKGVVVIGKEDAITTLRSLKEMFLLSILACY